MAKLTKREQLPSWFKLESYNVAKDFGTRDWLGHMNYRNVLQVRDHSDYNFATISAAVEKGTLNKLPIRFYPRAETYFEVFKNSSVAGISPLEKGWLKECIKNEKRPKSLPYDLNFANPNAAHATVNIFEKNIKTILKDFEEWLRTVHKPIAFDESDFSRWGKYQVLPYWDLTIWASRQGHTIHNRLMCSTLFGKKAPVDQVRKPKKAVEEFIQWRDDIDWNVDFADPLVTR